MIYLTQAVYQPTKKAKILANMRILLTRENDMGLNHPITSELAGLFAQVGGISVDEDMNDWCNVELETGVAIFAHLLQYLADDGVLIPEKVTLSAVLEPKEESNEPVVQLGDFFTLDRKLASDIANGNEDGLRGDIGLPNVLSSLDYQALSFRTNIQVSDAHCLTLRQCSLNLPIVHSGLKLEPGGTVSFHYVMSAMPKFEFIFPIKRASGELPDCSEVGDINVPGVKRFWHKASLVGDGRSIDHAFVENEMFDEMEMLANFDAR